jgi:hypothetical protein
MFAGKKVRLLAKESNPPNHYTIQIYQETKYFFGLFKKQEDYIRYSLCNGRALFSCSYGDWIEPMI